MQMMLKCYVDLVENFIFNMQLVEDRYEKRLEFLDLFDKRKFG